MADQEFSVKNDAKARARAPGATSRGSHAGRRPRDVHERAATIEAAGWEGAPRDESFSEGRSGRAVLRRDAFFRRSLALVDVLAAALSLVLALEVLRGGGTELRPEALLLLPIVVLVSKAIGLYDRDQHQVRKTTIDDAPQLLHVSVLFALIVWLGEGFFVDGAPDRGEVFGIAVLSFGLTLAGRSVVRAIGLAVTPVERCLVLGNADSAERIARRLYDAPSVNAVVAGRVALDAVPRNGSVEGPPVLGQVEELESLLAEHDIERVIIAPDNHDQEQILHAIRLVKALGVKVSVLPRLLEVVGSSSTFDEVNGITLLGVRHYGLSHSSEILKRAMDVTAAGLGLLLLAPLLLGLALAIKLDSRGPVFFRQRRIGRSGREFHMLKFRSMVAGAEAMKDGLREHNETEGLFKITEDPRITRVGSFLRRSSLDELPQLLNVVRGDMSLVGPRPLVPDEDAMIEGWQRRRLAVKPGMTGLWQIFGSSRIPMNEMVKIDYLYGANWSVWLDLKILFRTVPYVLSRRGM